MKLSFVFEEDEELLVSSQGGIPKPLARVVLTVTRTDGSRETVLTREFKDEFGLREESISFNTSEDEILKNHLDKLLEFLRRQQTSDQKE